MRVIITGSRDVGRDPNIVRGIIEHRLSELPHPGAVTVVHGAARGVDRIAGQEAQKAGLLVEEHPADWENKGKAAGFIRNQEMIDLGADLVLAFWDGKSRGTAHTIEAARKAGIPVEVVWL